MGCIVRKEASVNLEPNLEASKTKNPPKMNRIIKMLNWKSDLRPIAEAKSFMEFSSSTETFRS